jgi:hypothetical protein
VSQKNSTRQLELVNWEGDTPKGGILHVSAITDEGLRVVDNRLMSCIQEIGIEGQPRAEIHPVHALFTPAFQQKCLQLAEERTSRTGESSYQLIKFAIYWGSGERPQNRPNNDPSQSPTGRLDRGMSLIDPAPAATIIPKLNH